jgi:hypothetical protein
MARVSPTIALLFAIAWRATSSQDVATVFVEPRGFWSGADPSDYALAIDGASVPITRVVRAPQAVSAVVLIDASSSVRRASVDSLARWLADRASPDDSIRLASFAEKVLISPPFASRPDAAAAARAVAQGGGPSPLWDAMVASLKSVADRAGLRAVVVFTDAMRTANDHSFDDAAALAASIGATVSVVGVGDGALQVDSKILVVGRNDAIRQLVRDTGGNYVELQKRETDPARSLLALVTELRRRDRLEFTPPTRDGALHRIAVTAKGRPVRAPSRIRF